MAEKMARRTIVRQTTHPSDSRPNIPAAELESFARPGRRSAQQLGVFGPWLRT